VVVSLALALKVLVVPLGFLTTTLTMGCRRPPVVGVVTAILLLFFPIATAFLVAPNCGDAIADLVARF
jgi:hypothetical protein